MRERSGLINKTKIISKMNIEHMIVKIGKKGVKRPLVYSKGFTLIELLISLTLGITLLMVLVSLLVTGWTTYATSVGYSNANEVTRTTFNYLQVQIGHAGYRPQAWLTPEASYPYESSKTVIREGLSSVNVPEFLPGESVKAVRDSGGNLTLFLRKQGGLPSDPNIQDIRDCTGRQMNGTDVTTEIYQLDDNELACTAVDADDVAITEIIANDIVAMDALFGVIDSSHRIDTYCDIEKGGSTEGECKPDKTAAFDWKNVMNIKLSLVLSRADIGSKNISESEEGSETLFKNTDFARRIEVDTKKYIDVATQTIPLKNRLM